MPTAFRFELPAWVKEAMSSTNGSLRMQAALEAYLSLQLPKGLIATATDKIRRLQDIYLKSVETVARTELYGFAYSRGKCEKLVAYLVNEMANNEKEIYLLAGERWNLESHKDTANVSSLAASLGCVFYYSLIYHSGTVLEDATGGAEACPVHQDPSIDEGGGAEACRPPYRGQNHEVSDVGDCPGGGCLVIVVCCYNC